MNWTRGRLILWSNDMLRELVGDGFTNQQHAAEFLWWAKDHPGDPYDPPESYSPPTASIAARKRSCMSINQSIICGHLSSSATS